MDILSQNVSERIIQNMREGVVGQNALPPLLISLADDFVADCKGAIVCPLSLTNMQYIACCDLQSQRKVWTMRVLTYIDIDAAC